MASDPEKEAQHVHAAKMRVLLTSEGWDAYRGVLGDAELRWMERTCTGSRDEFDYHKGVIEGLRLAYLIPGQIIERAKSIT